MKKIIFTLFISLAASQANAADVHFTIKTNGLEPMRGQHYEGWNIVAGQALTTGRFSVSANGSIYQVNAAGEKLHKAGHNGAAKFAVDDSQLRSTLFILTIEPNGDTDAGPSKTHVMGGSYANQKAMLSIDHDSSIGTNFNIASGSFILAAPTGGNFNKGVWFLNPENGRSALDLPTLAKGWAYEGWIVNTNNGKKFSTGLFFDADGIDSDAAGPLAGPLKLSFPKVAGQDIVQSSVVLNDGVHAVVVTVEPYPDYDPAPYVIKILKTDLDASAVGMTPINLVNISASLPTGEVHFY